jgi:hypothetical protein
MDKDPSKKVAGRPRPVPNPSAAEESLTDALNGLEQILEHRRKAPTERDQREAKPSTPPPATDGQYTIPMLHDVVVQGADGRGHPAEHEHGAAAQADAADDEAYLKLAERLANEIEVIVQARVEDAVSQAATDIREQVRNHLEIMLPEIIEELNALTRR